jgi:hypothetical protein
MSRMGRLAEGEELSSNILFAGLRSDGDGLTYSRGALVDEINAVGMVAGAEVRRALALKQALGRASYADRR